MINILEAKKVFKEYVSNYNPDDEQVKIKIAHIERTSQIARKTAESLNLNKEDVDLAELIGLLHDIGRFEQIKRYHTFLDKDSINHGEFGVYVLFEEGLIRKFLKEDKYDEIIKKAILNHNRAKIEEGLSEKELLHAKLIRDSDKTDIFYALTIGDKKSIWGKDDISDEIISDEIYREFIEDRVINYKHMKSGADNLVAHFAYVFDFNFPYVLKNLKENKYLDTLYNRFTFKDEKTSKRYNEIYEIAKKYIDID